ncbi:hypothetical protein ACOSQ3_005103 [Xanthoceras sorbifolium]
MDFFTVKLGYWLAEERGDAGCSTSLVNQQWWRYFWLLQLPSKVKIFLWRACHNILPTATNLLARKISVSPLCYRCHKYEETVAHALWGCHLLQNIHAVCGFMGCLTNVIQDSMLDFLMFCRSVISSYNMQLLGIILWKVWHIRNCSVYQRPCMAIEEVVPWCQNFLADYSTAHFVPRPSRVERFVRWILPIFGHFTLNTNAALDHLRCKTGLGAVLRNHLGEVMLLGMFSFNGLLSPEIAEAKAILFGVSMALEGGFYAFSINSDVISVINCLVRGNLPLSELGVVLEDVLMLLQSFRSVFSFSHVPRSANKVAHVLAKYSFACNSWMIWVEDFPSFLFDVLTEDAQISL